MTEKYCGHTRGHGAPLTKLAKRFYASRASLRASCDEALDADAEGYRGVRRIGLMTSPRFEPSSACSIWSIS